MANPVVHFEIGAKNVPAARDFYSQLFGWKVDIDGWGYGLVDTGSDTGIDGGIMPATEERTPWVTFYVQVDDLEKTLSRAESLGGRRLMNPQPIQGMGGFAMFADPEDNVIGLLRREDLGESR